MKIVADESVDFPIIRKLRENHFEVVAIAELCAGVADEEVLKIAQEMQSLLVTADKDFGELSFRLDKVSYGIVLLRFSGMSNLEKAEIVLKVMQTYGQNLQNKFTVVTKSTLRIRDL